MHCQICIWTNIDRNLETYSIIMLSAVFCIMIYASRRMRLAQGATTWTMLPLSVDSILDLCQLDSDKPLSISICALSTESTICTWEVQLGIFFFHNNFIKDHILYDVDGVNVNCANIIELDYYTYAFFNFTTHSLENNSVYTIPSLISGQLHFLNACDIGRGYCDILRFVDISRSHFKSSRESLENLEMLYFHVYV